MKPTACPPPLIDKQQGSVLLEALIAILIFSFGILGLIGIQASAVGLSIDAKHRADAAYLANQIVSQMWVDRANMDTYAHNPGGNACDPGTGAGAAGGASANTKVHDGANSGSWTDQVAQSLPGATDDKQQIRVRLPPPPATPVSRIVEITLCWKRPSETAWHRHVTATQINQ